MQKHLKTQRIWHSSAISSFEFPGFVIICCNAHILIQIILGEEMKKILPFLKILMLEYIVSVVLLLITAVLMYKVGISRKTAQIIVYFIYFLAAFTGGIILGKLKNGKRLIWGLCAGGLYFVVLTVISLLMKSSPGADGNIIWAFLCSILGGGFGGMCS
jgi:putative membrane protein (TIGR04086 family)